MYLNQFYKHLKNNNDHRIKVDCGFSFLKTLQIHYLFKYFIIRRHSYKVTKTLRGRSAFRPI